jgi:hypothetical protein
MYNIYYNTKEEIILNGARPLKTIKFSGLKL